MSRKVKYNYEFKLHCVKEVFNKHRSIKTVASEQCVSESNLKKWVLFYRMYGNTGLIPRQYENYSAEFKLGVLQTIEKDNLSLNNACLRFNIPTNSILVQWRKIYEKFGIKGLENKPRGRIAAMDIKRKKRKPNKPLTREEELLQENEILRAENALLKKLQALIQAEENRKRKP